MFPIALIASLLSSLLLVITTLGLASAIRRTTKSARIWWYATVALMIVKLADLVALIGFGVAFAPRPLRDVLLLGGPFVATAVRRAELPARLLAVTAGASAAMAFLAQNPLAYLTILGVFTLVGLIVMLDTVRPATLRWPRSGRLAAPLTLALALTAYVVVGTATGGIPAAASMSPHNPDAAVRSVTTLTGDQGGGAVRRFTVTARPGTVTLASGARAAAWIFAGDRPAEPTAGPSVPIVVRQNDTVEVTLFNRLPDASTTIHWHGVDVPNAMDGAPGMTQDAVKPGGAFTYRFTVHQVGTFWYHPHQMSDEQVTRGLFGMFVVQPTTPADVEQTIAIHNWRTDRGDRLAFGLEDGVTNRQVRAGQTVRVRMIDTANTDKHVVVAGTRFRLAAVDGSDLHEPGELSGVSVPVGGGGRADLAFTMPAHPVRISLAGQANPALVLSPDGRSTIDPQPAGPDVDLTAYGTPLPTQFDASSRFGRDYTVDIDLALGFYAGTFRRMYTLNGEVFPDAPILRARSGDLVRVTMRNRSFGSHPMHLHGHRVLLLSYNGKPVTGSPLWMDTVLLRPGDSAVMAFRADNPGIWMYHCHELSHAAAGMMLHLAYDGVGTPFTVGTDTGNLPE